MKIQDRTKVVSYAIRDIVVPARELEKQGHKILKLNIGDPDKYDFDTPDYIKEAAIKAIKEGKNFYGASEGNPEIREAVAKREKRLKNVDVKPEDVMPTAGASEGINMILASLVGKDDEVLMPGPSYPLYISLTRFYDGKPVEYKTVEENGWQPDLDDFESKITDKTKLILVINPNNPTGAVYPKETLSRIADIAAEKNIPILCDEIYDMLSFDKEFISLGTMNQDANYILIGGLSKVYLSPGWRMAYLGFKGPDIEELKQSCFRMARARLSTNTPAQFAMKSAFESEPHLEKTKKIMKERRDFSVKRINEIDGLSVSKPEGALYMFPKIEKEEFKDDRKFVLDLLHKKHVLCVHGSGFGDYGKEHFRTVFLPPIETLEEAFNRIEEFMGGK